ncbi:hypothetical protein [Tropicibacter sp. S64]|uniref:hypothetical protein n=1 Tax=Tropicibacter sp. S64 TaxID=3415122 RepID=UPI003C7A5002
MTHACNAVSSLVFLVLSGPLAAADFADPTWPCVQRKVERLSIGLMWPTPVDPAFKPSKTVAGEITELAESLALRRLELADLEPQVAAFADAHGGDPAILGAVFQQVFDTLANRRTQVMDGIGRFSLGQISLSEKIDAARVQFDAEMAKAEPDLDLVDKLEETIDWDQVIYTDRQQSITYLCETPVLLEKRLFAVAQMLQRHMKE